MAENQTVLFHSTIFGPIHSRRLGISLGINLLPNDGKVCSFDCIYCEAGYNKQGHGSAKLPSPEQVRHDLEAKLKEMAAEGKVPDTITFSGNGEPTLHPQFAGIVDIVLELRDKYAPKAKTSVLTNSTRLSDPKVEAALLKTDNAILKLDSAIEPTMRLIDCPNSPGFTVGKVIGELKKFSGKGIIQTMLLRGEHKGLKVDNTTPEEIEALLNAYREIQPREVMLYSIDRPTPEERLQKVPREEIEVIADQVRALGIPTQVN